MFSYDDYYYYDISPNLEEENIARDAYLDDFIGDESMAELAEAFWRKNNDGDT